MSKTGFFSASAKIFTSKPVSFVTQCGACGLIKTSPNPKIKPKGNFAKKILILSEAPIWRNDELQLLKKELAESGATLHHDCSISSSILCQLPGNVTPKESMAQNCIASITKIIKQLEPNVIILLGPIPTKTLIKAYWKEQSGPFNRWSGFQIASQKPNTWICPTFHPSYVLQKNNPLVNLFFSKHINKAVEKSNAKPWKKVKDFQKEICVEINPNKAAKKIRKMLGNSKMAAFDYETNRIKPDHAKAEIVSCSICFDGEYTIAYPWHGESIKATVEFFKSPIKKIAANMKFEDRWTKAILGIRIKRLVWDTMIAQHLIDNRKGVTGLKFQSFLYLGMTNYDNHIKPFFDSDKNGFNRIHEIDLRELLLYNGLDSLLTYRIAQIQMKGIKDTTNEL